MCPCKKSYFREKDMYTGYIHTAYVGTLPKQLFLETEPLSNIFNDANENIGRKTNCKVQEVEDRQSNKIKRQKCIFCCIQYIRHVRFQQGFCVQVCQYPDKVRVKLTPIEDKGQTI